MNRYVFAAARLVNAGLLVWALARHPIGYYTALRFVTCGVCAYAAYVAVKSQHLVWTIAFGAIAILFNPLVSFRMTRQTWAYVDVIVAIFLVVSVFVLRDRS